jgi:hypothetical protein
MKQSKKFYSRWNEDENQFLRDNVRTMSNKDLAKSLDRTYASVLNQRRKIGLGTWDYTKHKNITPPKKSRVLSFGPLKITLKS